MPNPTATRPAIQVLWAHQEGNIALRLLDIDYGYHTHGVSALVVKLEIVNVDNDDTFNYYFEDKLKSNYVQYLQQYVNARIRAKFQYDSDMVFKFITDLFKTKLEKDSKQFDNHYLLLEGAKIFGENFE